MSFTRRGKAALIAGAVALIAVVVGGAALAFPGKAPAFIRQAAQTVGIVDAPPPTCPLTGRVAAGGTIPARGAMAVKIENIPEARPQSGLDRADIVYEEPVEGGITRFIVLFQCREAGRIGPVRSGRLTDPDVLVQFGHPAMAYAGGVNAVKRAIEDAGLVDLNYLDAAKAYTRDPGREAPHDLYTSTAALYAAAKSADRIPPEPVFAYDRDLQQKAKHVATVHIPFSGYSDVYWRWGPKERAWLRSHGDTAHTLEDGRQVAADNVVVMQVEVHDGMIVDAAGNPSPEVTLTGRGKVFVFRSGRMIVGRWERASLADVTTLTARDGSEIVLTPGVTWVELVPSTVDVTASR